MMKWLWLVACKPELDSHVFVAMVHTDSVTKIHHWSYAYAYWNGRSFLVEDGHSLSNVVAWATPEQPI